MTLCYSSKKPRFVFLGFGAVAQCLLELLKVKLSITHQDVLILDKNIDCKLKALQLFDCVQFERMEFAPDHFNDLLPHVREGDLIIDLSYRNDTLMLTEWCQKNKLFLKNSAIELGSGGSLSPSLGSRYEELFI
jgi:homospermidine synthase